jgi:hypothetical protein
MKRFSIKQYLAAIGKKGGRRNTPAQQSARAENGKKGGRPATAKTARKP